MSDVAEADRRAGVRLGLALVVLGIVLNEWVLARWLSADNSLALSSRLGIWLLDLGLIGTGAAIALLRVAIPWKLVVGNLLVFTLLLGLAEGFLVLALRWPILLPSGRPLGMVEILYAWHRNIIQFSRECGRYDARLGYTLRPGVCRFENPEFSTEYRINSAGLRDDEASLDAPKIIVLGDSFAMGWGVEQQQAFPQILEASLETPVLNAAVSSFGTARASVLLSQLDRSRLKILIIQYCANDFDENESFRESGNRLAVSSPERYHRRVETYERDRRYRFGSHLFRLTKTRIVEPALIGLAAAISPQPTGAPLDEAPPGDGRQAELFLQVLEAGMSEPFPERILVLEIDRYRVMDSAFVTELGALLRVRAGHPLLSRVEPLDLSGRLKPEHYYRLDEHLNADGHRAVAAAIRERIPADVVR